MAVVSTFELGEGPEPLNREYLEILRTPQPQHVS